jgi:hypothetical protein
MSTQAIVVNTSKKSGTPAKENSTSIRDRISALDWTAVQQSLDDHGHALTPALLSPAECAELVALYTSDHLFRSHIVMARYRFGRGDYKYFDYPLPPLVHDLRKSTYSHLSDIANSWNEALEMKFSFPRRHSEFLAACKKKGQSRATPLLLHYERGDFNCLHQDLYGDVAFPLQLTCFLSRPGIDYEGGEFVLVEQQPRAQSKAHVIVARQGEALIFATRYRPVKGTRGYYRTALRHGVSTITRGVRYTLGIIYHDAK